MHGATIKKGVLLVSIPDNNTGYLSDYADFFIRNKAIQIWCKG
jgi:hypothetical protein